MPVDTLEELTTLDAVTAALARSTAILQWKIHHERIRGFDQHGGRYCPITAACEAQPDVLHWWKTIARDAGIPSGLAKKIADAADNVHSHDPAMRAHLLAALGLQEVTDAAPLP